MNRQISLLWVMIGIFSISASTTSLALPTTLVVKSKEKKELCYEIGKIDKIIFVNRQLVLKHKQDAVTFTPSAIDYGNIDLIFFSKERHENGNKMISPTEEGHVMQCAIKDGILSVSGLSKADKQLMIYSSDGQLVISEPINATSLSFHTSLWPSGIYILTTSQNKTTKIVLP